MHVVMVREDFDTGDTELAIFKELEGTSAFTVFVGSTTDFG